MANTLNRTTTHVVISAKTNGLYTQHKSQAAASRQCRYFRANTTSHRDALVLTADEFLARRPEFTKGEPPTNLSELAEFFPVSGEPAKASKVRAVPMQPGETYEAAKARQDATTARILAQQAKRKAAK